MSFFQDQDHRTIAALATPPGKGALAIIRLSGKKAKKIASRIFSKNVELLPSHTVHFGFVSTLQGQVIDTVLVIPMHAPKSFTGEDVVEIHCHGGSVIIRKILDELFAAGAFPANPGEFSLRAFLNKKIDLTQAEAIQDAIHAENEVALFSAEEQLMGHLSKKIQTFQKQLIDTIALFEAWVDFPEEELPLVSYEKILCDLTTVKKEMEKLCNSYAFSQKLKTGISLCLAGAPNVGKSSLLNLLLKKDRAIVTPIPGTTRDLIEEEFIWKNLHFKLVDTAGIRETEECIEKEGILRSKRAILHADLILLLLDASQPLTQEDKTLLTLCPKEKTMYVWNKIDLCPESTSKPDPSSFLISVKEEKGIEALMEGIFSKIEHHYPQGKDQIILTQKRHKQALDQALHYLNEVFIGLEEKRSFEFLSCDLRSALHELATILGQDITEEILNSIFSHFCIGK